MTPTHVIADPADQLTICGLLAKTACPYLAAQHAHAHAPRLPWHQRCPECWADLDLALPAQDAAPEDLTQLELFGGAT